MSDVLYFILKPYASTYVVYCESVAELFPGPTDSFLPSLEWPTPQVNQFQKISQSLLCMYCMWTFRSNGEMQCKLEGLMFFKSHPTSLKERDSSLGKEEIIQTSSSKSLEWPRWMVRLPMCRKKERKSICVTDWPESQRPIESDNDLMPVRYLSWLKYMNQLLSSKQAFTNGLEF